MFFAGPRRALVRHKFKLGTTIMLFTGMLASCNKSADTTGEVMCYAGIYDGGPDSSTDTDTDIDTDTDSDTDTEISCYEAVEENTMQVSVALNDQGQIELHLQEDNTLEGTVWERQGVDFSFRITDATDATAQEGAIDAEDGAYDESTEEFVIEVDTGLPSGEYVLRLYATTLANVDLYGTMAQAAYELLVVND